MRMASMNSTPFCLLCISTNCFGLAHPSHVLKGCMELHTHGLGSVFDASICAYGVAHVPEVLAKVLLCWTWPMPQRSDNSRCGQVTTAFDSAANDESDGFARLPPPAVRKHRALCLIRLR
ncbi:hypothetical protein BD289DRAFT_94769 [Coniella lustricola]|uniref:Secreted protein n=1 Tax=Coniella lustricola TaxID=2025994 RepID=A0A2T2ZYA6_9PEZI|nr:hypothetical protein BD289DRAFT_94769 [Coniella lustricola]